MYLTAPCTCTSSASSLPPCAVRPDHGGEDCLNPLESRPRWRLAVRASTLRLAARLAFSIANSRSPSVDRVVWLDSTLGAWKGTRKIRVQVWEPLIDHALQSQNKRPLLINFHGGGFVLGQGTDDARWASAAMAALGTVVFSVNYRLGPGYPFPTAVEDCADSIVQICNRADEFRIDTDRVILSGFSSGGGLSLASWAVLQDPTRWGYHLRIPALRIVGMALFYPPLDFTLSRCEKRLSCTRPDLTLSKYLTDLFDAAYIHPPLPRTERNDLRLSPGLMPEEWIDRLPPVHLCLCEYDMLLAEGVRFSERLKGRDKRVRVRMVAGEKHGWDKRPVRHPQSVSVEYNDAVKEMEDWLELANRSSLS